MKRIGKHISPRLLVAPIIVGVGLLAAVAGSSSALDGGKSSRADLRRLASGAVVSAGVTAAARPQIKHGPPVKAVAFNRDLRTLPRSVPRRRERPEHELEAPPGLKETLPSADQAPAAAAAATAPAPNPISSFKGLDYATWGDGHPPDTVGDVGPTVFVQAVNTSIGIFDKSTGDELAATTFDDLFTGTGTSCDSANGGDPTVVYDPLGDRWIVADFAFEGDGSSPPFYECIAVSKTGDPVSGGWYFYAIRADDAEHPWFPDYPKMGIWPDGLYMTANMFSNTFEEVRVWAFNRADLESGGPVRNVVVDLGTSAYFSLLPSTMHVVTGVPPAGRDNILVSESESAFAWEVWRFHPDYSGAGTTFTFTPTNVSQGSYSLAPSTVPTPANTLDSLRERLMMQAQYTNLGGAESIWVNHTVRCCGTSSSLPAGIQWAQLNVTGGNVSPSPVQEQVYPSANDGLHRWMGSLAVDEQGDMALGYSVANGSTNPDIRYAGRLAGDPPGTLPQTETSMLQGVVRGSQNGNCGSGQCHRWGDYSAMSIDPDGCTFWYTQEYYETTGLDWQTRIGSFKLEPKTCQKITFGSLPNRTFGDGDFVVAATATSGLPVSFAANGGCTVNGSTVHITGAGSCTITASQNGNATFNAALPVVQSFAIAKAGQSITFAPLAARTFGDPDFTVSASASSGLTVAFTAAGSCAVGGTTVHIAGGGSCTVTASQPGDGNYNAAADIAQTFTIAKLGQTIAFGPLADKTLGDADFAVSATASSGLPVSFAASGSCTLSGAKVHLTAAGSCTVAASQAGNANFNAATNVQRSFAIHKPPATCRVPRVVGKRLAAAKAALVRSHCATGKVSRAYSKLTRKGRISAQSRRAGRVLPAHSKVNLVVSRGRRP